VFHHLVRRNTLFVAAAVPQNNGMKNSNTSAQDVKVATASLPATLTTARLILRPWQTSDTEPFTAMSQDPEVMAHLLAFTSREAIAVWIQRQQAHFAKNGFGFWAIESRDTGEFMGATGLLCIAYEAHFTPAVEIGWRLARRFWGQGYVPEAARFALQFGFENLGLSEIVANTVSANHNSRRVMEKLGMFRDPADDFDHPLVPVDSPLRRQMLYRLKRESWSSLGG
jgi:RimJ/RimL family protein N-acetyltransferase